MIFLPGLKWGLPNSSSADLLFGLPKSALPAWSGKQTLSHLQPAQSSASLSADADAITSQSADSNQPLAFGTLLNQTDAQRAEIISRYRLYSYQPDEMLTLRALSSMKPGELDFDPKLYHYGGFWIYPSAALLKTADIMGLVTVKSDTAYYLDHPSDFADFYVVLRLHVLFWTFIGSLAVYSIFLQLGLSRFASAVSAVAWLLMPAIVCFGYEGKPHLPGLSLSLITLALALRQHWVMASLVSGLAVSCVVSASCAALIPLCAIFVASVSAKQKLQRSLISLAIIAVTYCLLNVYVLIHLASAVMGNATPLGANTQQVSSFYSLSIPGESALSTLASAYKMLRLAIGPMLPVLPVLPFGYAAFRFFSGSSKSPSATSPPTRSNSLKNLCLILLPAATANLLISAAAAPNMPYDFARLYLLPATAAFLLFLASGFCFAQPLLASRPTLRFGFVVVWPVAVGLISLVDSVHYVLGYIADSRPTATTRYFAGQLANRVMKEQGVSSIAVTSDMAPYALPPMNLFAAEITRVSPAQLSEANADALVIRYDAQHLTPMSWANRAFFVLVQSQAKPAEGSAAHQP